MQRVGVFGGSFDPVHWGHLHVALLAREAADLDLVLFLPAAAPPHKPGRRLAPAADRRAMLLRALESEPGTALCDLELEPGGPRYTVDTMDRLAALHPEWTLSFILGMDSLLEFSTWKEPDRLAGRYRLIAVNRPGGATEVPSVWPGRVDLVNGNPFAISSRAIRERVARDQSIRHLVPAPVGAYIAEHRLYGPVPASEGTQ